VSSDSVDGAAGQVATKTIQPEAGFTYQFTFAFAAVVGNPRSQTMAAQIAVCL
jgi:hypothetical protein